MHRVVGAAVLRSGASSPTDAMSPARTATACAKRELASSVMILPLWRMRSGGSMDRQSRAFSDALPPPLMLRSLAALALRGVSKGRCVDLILRDGRSRALLKMRGEA